VTHIDKGKVLTAYPFQVLEYGSEIVLKRGTLQLLIKGKSALNSVLHILISTSGKKSSRRHILDQFPVFRQEEISSLLDEMISKRFLIEVNIDDEVDLLSENRADVFHWQLGEESKHIDKSKESTKINIIGINELSIDIYKRLKDYGYKNITAIDLPMLGFIDSMSSNPNIETKNYDHWLDQLDNDRPSIIVGCSEISGQLGLIGINQLCVEKNIPFYPIVIQELKAQLGPLVIPHRSACLQCLRSRQNAHIQDVPLERFHEAFLQEGQDVLPRFETLIKLAVEMSVFQILKFLSFENSIYHPSLLAIDPLNGSMEQKKVLKIPRCPICSSLTKNSYVRSDIPVV